MCYWTKLTRQHRISLLFNSEHLECNPMYAEIDDKNRFNMIPFEFQSVSFSLDSFHRHCVLFFTQSRARVSSIARENFNPSTLNKVVSSVFFFSNYCQHSVSVVLTEGSNENKKIRNVHFPEQKKQLWKIRWKLTFENSLNFVMKTFPAEPLTRWLKFVCLCEHAYMPISGVLFCFVLSLLVNFYCSISRATQAAFCSVQFVYLFIGNLQQFFIFLIISILFPYKKNSFTFQFLSWIF